MLSKLINLPRIVFKPEPHWRGTAGAKKQERYTENKLQCGAFFAQRCIENRFLLFRRANELQMKNVCFIFCFVLLLICEFCASSVQLCTSFNIAWMCMCLNKNEERSKTTTSRLFVNCMERKWSWSNMRTQLIDLFSSWSVFHLSLMSTSAVAVEVVVAPVKCSSKNMMICFGDQKMWSEVVVSIAKSFSVVLHQLFYVGLLMVAEKSLLFFLHTIWPEIIKMLVDTHH